MPKYPMPGWFSQNGAWERGNPENAKLGRPTSISGPAFPAVSVREGDQRVVNFGASPFRFTPPKGFLAVFE